MFSPEELEALVLGARWVQSQPDTDLSDAARNAFGKIATASPDDLRDRISDTGLWPVRVWGEVEPLPLLGLVRQAMRNEKALRIDYSDEKGRSSSREIWPVQLAYYENKQIVAAWCTLRDDFRHFRTERIEAAEITSARYGQRRAALSKQWFDQWRPNHGQRQ